MFIFFFENDPGSRLAALFYPSFLLGYCQNWTWSWGTVDYTVFVERPDGICLQTAELGEQDCITYIKRKDFEPASISQYEEKGRTWVWTDEAEREKVMNAAELNRERTREKLQYMAYVPHKKKR
ncbi:hypothetical protein AV654_17635 [Paenibacillus elgii]|uniref:Uncharacterized protein n=1 Tax=Paenibacillus elgii TaxID=189691 RepID=A0A163YEC1_9BACL|nr:hypothetical protein [Paenibacillus elgii]KZE79293.1 hypothetical protein AV654_17635 [Paenibacillus elgii]